jgi:hypothetical protein
MLRDEGLSVTVSRDFDIAYPQERIINALIKDVAGRSEFDFIFPIDGDEFIVEAQEFRNSLKGIAAGEVGSVEWAVLVPNDSHSMQRPNPLYDGFSRRRSEVHVVRKVILPNSVARNAVVSMGNHSATNRRSQAIPNTPLPVTLYHVPVRSKEQIIAKALIGSNKLSIKEGRDSGQGFHWDLIARQIRKSEFELSDEQLRHIALSYGWHGDDPIVADVIPVSLSPENQVLKYSDLGRVNLSMLLDGFARQLCAQIAAHQRTPARTVRLLASRAYRRLARRRTT